MAINLSDSIRVGQQKPIDDKYYNGLNPYTSTTEANSLLPSAIRYKGLTVNINNVEYWYKTGIADVDLIEKTSGSTGVLDTPLTGFQATQGVVTSSDTILTGLEKIAANALDVSSTGVYSFAGVTLASSTTFNVGAAKGFIVDNTTNLSFPTVIEVNYAGATGLTDPNINTSTETYILLDSSATLILQPTYPTPQQRRQNIFLGKLGHPDKLVFLNAFSQPDVFLSPLSQLRDVWTPINLINSGVYPSPNGANLQFNTSAGTLYGLGINFSNDPLAPSTFSFTAQSPTTFRYRTQIGGTSGNITTIDPTNYDLGGVITAISGTGGNSTNQRIYALQNGQVRIQYGQQVYNSLTEAIAGIQTETFITFPNFLDNAILIGILSITKNCTDLTNTNRARILLVSKFGESVGAAGGVSTTTLQQAYNNSVQPEIVTNSTLGAVTFKRGSAADTDNVVEIQNAAGTDTVFITGSGVINATSTIINQADDLSGSKFQITGNSIFNGNITIGQTYALKFIQDTSIPTPTVGYSVLDSVNQSLQFIANSGSTNYRGFALDASASTLNSFWYYNMPNNNGTLALISDIHNPVTIGTPANGLSLATQVLSLGLSSSTTTGALSSANWTTFNGKQDSITGAATTITTSNLTISRVLVSDASGKVAVSTVTTTTLSYLDATSSIQTQLNGKQSTLTNPVTGTGTSGYISKFNGTSSIAISSIFESLTTSNVGIGNLASGTEKLQVTGDAVFQNTGAETVTIKSTSTGNAILTLLSTSTSSKSVINSSLSTGSLSLQTNTVDRLGISSSGNIYINQVDDITNRLQVTGNTKLTGSLTVTTLTSGQLPLAGTSGLLGNSVVYQSGSNIGIGTITPGTSPNNTLLGFVLGSNIQARTGVPQLALSSNIDGDWYAPTYKTSGYAAQIIIDPANMGGGANGIGFNVTASGTVGGTITWNRAMTIIASGFVGIGTASPSFNLDVTGTGRFTSKLTIASGNDWGTFYSTVSGNNYATLKKINGTDDLAYIGDSPSTIGIGSANDFAIRSTANLILYPTGNVGIGNIAPAFKLDVTGTGRFTSTLQASNIGAGIAANVSSYLNTAVNTASVGQILLPKSAVDYTGTLAGMLWNNAMEFKFYDDVLVTVNRLLKLNGNTALVNSNPLNVVTSTGTGGNLGTLKAEVAFSRFPTAVSYTILLTDVGFGWVIGVTSTAAARTITLPLANSVPAGWQTTVKDESGGALTNNITIARSNTDTIDGATSVAIALNYGSRTLYSDGVSKWFLI